MIKIIIDGKTYEVNPEKNLLETILSLGIDLPYFCWHPAMGSVGACRQCAVTIYRDENDKTGKIAMACMESLRDGMRVSVKDREAHQFRANVIEWLMTNHPHDCPVCDEGGECHLQDMTVMSGHNYRRYRFNKRTYRNQYLGPFINHEMNRCIQCYRCVRFYRDYAGGDDLNVFAAHNHVYFGRHEDGVLENEFSGNLVEVCPTGVFTDKTLKQHYTRKWDFSNAPSICPHCSLGCNIIAGERYGSLRRVLSRYNGAVNGYFLCDRGRFGYEFVNSPKRVIKPSFKDSSDAVGKKEALDKCAELIKKGKRLIGIGSPRASLESNFVLKKWVGEDNFYLGVSDSENMLVTESLNILRNSNVRTPSLSETEKADAVLVLGEDVTNTVPMLALALRQSIRQQPLQKALDMKIPSWNDAAVRELNQEDKGPLFIASPCATKLDEVATQTSHIAPDEIARIGFAIAHAIDSSAPPVTGLSKEQQTFIDAAAKSLKEAKRPLIVSGCSSGSIEILHAAANTAMALRKSNNDSGLFLCVPESNSLGLAMLGGKPLGEALKNSQKETVAILLEIDLYTCIENEQADKFFKNTKTIALGYLQNASTEKADTVIPVGTFAESDGTLVNNEGRAQRFYQGYEAPEPIGESWCWLNEMMQACSKNDLGDLKIFDDYVNALISDYPIFNGIEKLAPPAGFRIAGQKIPRSPHRYTGRTAMNAHKNVSEPKPPEDMDSALSFTMEGYRGKPPSSVIPYFWSPGWNSAQSINKFQIEVGGPLHDGDPGVRLIETDTKNKTNYFKTVPKAYRQAKDKWLLVPIYHIFGSERLSLLSPAIEERAPEPYVVVSSSDAEKMNVQNNQNIKIAVKSHEFSLPCRINESLAAGTAGISVIPGEIPFIEFPIIAELTGEQK
jgi:NADH-quinone oxidoreductase subunit G